MNRFSYPSVEQRKEYMRLMNEDIEERLAEAQR